MCLFGSFSKHHTVRCLVHGEFFTQCASSCPATCDDPRPQCDQPCQPGCSCDAGLIYGDRSKKMCVRPSKCPGERCAMVRCLVSFLNRDVTFVAVLAVCTALLVTSYVVTSCCGTAIHYLSTRDVVSNLNGPSFFLLSATLFHSLVVFATVAFAFEVSFWEVQGSLQRRMHSMKLNFTPGGLTCRSPF